MASGENINDSIDKHNDDGNWRNIADQHAPYFDPRLLLGQFIMRIFIAQDISRKQGDEQCAERQADAARQDVDEIKECVAEEYWLAHDAE